MKRLCEDASCHECKWLLFLLEKLFIIHQYIEGVVTYLVAKGNHCVFVMKNLHWPPINVLVISAPDGMM